MAGSVKATARERQTSKLIVASFTRTAAAEIAGRGLPIDRDQVGTLHALAYRSIGRPQVAEEVLADWNREQPPLALSAGYKSLEDTGIDLWRETDGDVLLGQVDNLRARMIPREAWPASARNFDRRWSDWKQRSDVIDFTDMIELALSNTEEAPGSPIVGFFDEVQDFTPLELALVRHWGRRMERVILAGDDDQCIYSFKGATPDAFLDPPVPEENKRVLSQSYRVPRAVHAAAETWVRHLSRREPKEYLPRDADGVVRHAPFSFEEPDDFVRAVAREADAGRSVMVLATCAYMLDKVKHGMRAEGLPFHNPYRRTRGDWNPLRARRGTSSAEKLLAYLIIDQDIFGELSRLWTGADVKRWTSVVKKQGIFRRGASGMIEGLPDRELRYEEVAQLFESESELEAAVTPDVAWFVRNLLAAARAPMEFPVQVVRRRGGMALMEEPRVTIGTIHSVKGGESDVVMLMPDLSLAGYREWDNRRTRDSVVRQMYVGMTRAREELVICNPGSSYAVEPELMLRRR